VWVRDASCHGLAGVALPPPLVVPGQTPSAAPLRVVELRDRVEPARAYVHPEKTHNNATFRARMHVILINPKVYLSRTIYGVTYIVELN
jgi:hypothetical protein